MTKIFLVWISSSHLKFVLIDGLMLYHLLPSIIFITWFYQSFSRYDYKDVYRRISQLRMKPNELVEDFPERFLHLCYEFLGEDTYLDLFKNNFECFINISLHGESKPLDVYYSPTRENHETPLILEEEPVIPFVPYPPPFLVLHCAVSSISPRH